MPKFPAVTLTLWLAVCATAQNSAPVTPSPTGPQQDHSFQSAVAARCQVTEVRRVGLEGLIKMACAENRLSMEVWLPPREPALWMAKDLAISVVPIIMAPDVHVSPGRTPRSDYSRPKPVHVQIIGGPHKKVVATLVSMTFH